MQRDIPVYTCDGELIQFVDEKRVLRLIEFGRVARVVKNRAGHQAGDIHLCLVSRSRRRCGTTSARNTHSSNHSQTGIGITGSAAWATIRAKSAN